MAETEPVKKKRRIRPASTETVRERAQKAQEQSAKPPKKRLSGLRSVLRGFFAPILWVLRKIGRLLRPLRFILRPLKWLGRHIIPRYFKNSWAELRLVTWPGRKQSRQLTSAVVLFALVFSIFISLLDLGLDKIFKRILLK